MNRRINFLDSFENETQGQRDATEARICLLTFSGLWILLHLFEGNHNYSNLMDLGGPKGTSLLVTSHCTTLI